LPAEDHDDGDDDHGADSPLAGHPFVLLMSRFPGSHVREGHEIPIGRDLHFAGLLDAARAKLFGRLRASYVPGWPVVGSDAAARGTAGRRRARSTAPRQSAVD
jgi:hypothetical protein